MIVPRVHDRDLVDEAHEHVDVVLDHQHGAALLALQVRGCSRRARHVARADARHRLVEQDDARLRRQQHGDLELALVAVRDVARGGVGLWPRPTASSFVERELGRGIRSPRKAEQRCRRRRASTWAASRTFSSTAEPREQARGLECAPESRPRPRGHRRRVMSWPSSRTRPAVGLTTPEITLKSVVLPAPFGPDDSDAASPRRRRVDILVQDRRAADLKAEPCSEREASGVGHGCSSGPCGHSAARRAGRDRRRPRRCRRARAPSSPPSATSLAWYISWIRAWSSSRTVISPLTESKVAALERLDHASTSPPPSLHGLHDHLRRVEAVGAEQVGRAAVGLDVLDHRGVRRRCSARPGSSGSGS